MSGRFEGNFDRIDRAIDSALNPTSMAFAKAANQYVKKDTGATEASVWSDSNFPKGKVVWGTEYAGYAYYMGAPSKNHNPQASIRWAEVAKAQDMDEVLAVAEKSIKEAL